MKVYLKVSIVLVAALFNQVQSESVVPEPSACICTYEYTPVCASDGTTYANQCAFECAQDNKPELTSVCQHECPCNPIVGAKENACFCPKLYFPVCASNHVTYPNRCYLQCAQKSNPSITEVRIGNCDDSVST